MRILKHICTRRFQRHIHLKLSIHAHRSSLLKGVLGDALISNLGECKTQLRHSSIHDVMAPELLGEAIFASAFESYNHVKSFSTWND